MKFINVRPDDYPELIDLNESCIPHVNSIGIDDLVAFQANAFCFNKLCDWHDRLGGFVIALQPGKSYRSLNYRWFESRYETFVYIDRIMIHADFRRKGLALRIYKELEKLAREANIPRLCCEVNRDPPNPASHQLHQRLGFESVGIQYTQDNSKQVDMLVKLLSP